MPEPVNNGRNGQGVSPGTPESITHIKGGNAGTSGSGSQGGGKIIPPQGGSGTAPPQNKKK